MLRYAARRLAIGFLIVIGVVALTFFIAHIVPGNPAALWAGPRATKQEIAQARVVLGLNHPIWYQILHYYAGIFTGNWGLSARTHRPVLGSLLQVVPASLELILTALLIAALVGVPLGLVAARFRGKAIDTVLRLGSVSIVSMPAFLTALLLQLLFFRVLGVLPAAGEYSANFALSGHVPSITGIVPIDALLTADWALLGSSLQHLVLPALAIATYPAGVAIRMVRALVIEASDEVHSQMARSLGFSESTVLGHFAVRLAVGPLVQVLALIFAYSLVNTFLVEAVFDWPGLGSYAAQSIEALDTPAIMGITLFVAIVYVAGNLLVDLIQAMVDPRIRLT